MGYGYAAGFKESVGRERGLECHLESNFYPPLPQFVKDSTIKGFNLYWAGEMGIEELREACYLRDVNALYRYHGVFLEGEEE